MQLKPTEKQICLAFCDEMRLLQKQGKFQGIFYKNDNEGKRSPRAGAEAKRLGLFPGLADYTVIAYSNEHPIAFVEFKGWSRSGSKGKMSDAQKEFRIECWRLFIPYGCFWDAREAIDWLRMLEIIEA